MVRVRVRVRVRFIFVEVVLLPGSNGVKEEALFLSSSKVIENA